MGTHAVLLVGPDGCIQKLNADARALFGECVGRPCSEVVAVRDILCAKSGCQKNCARLLAQDEGESRAAVGAVRGRPCRVVCAGLGDQVVVTLVDAVGLPVSVEALTPREREVITLVARGLPGNRIAHRLGISPATVRTHVEHSREKLGARTRAEAVARALALGLI